MPGSKYKTPKWIHDRAHHIMRKDRGVGKSTAYAIATQQSHASEHTPGSWGTEEGREEAKEKYEKPASSYEQTADPKEKKAHRDAMFGGFLDELDKIAAGVATPPVPTAPSTPASSTVTGSSGKAFGSSGVKSPTSVNPQRPLAGKANLANPTSGISGATSPTPVSLAPSTSPPPLA